MKEYEKILNALPSNEYQLIRHEWGQHPETIYNNVVDAWNSLQVGQSIFILSRKVYGLKSLIAFLRKKGLQCDIVGKKGATDTRMIEISKSVTKNLSPITSSRPVLFSFREKSYEVNVGNAIFSKKGLDEGTKFLLETFFEKINDADGKIIGDLGAGWGAIALVLATELPAAKIIAFEKESGALEACKENLGNFKNIRVVKGDMTDIERLRPYTAMFDYVVSNFSFHITNAEREGFFQTIQRLLKEEGRVFLVAEGRFVSRCEKTAKKYLHILDKKTWKGYTVFVCSHV